MTRDGCCSNPTHHLFSNTGAGSTLTHNKIPKPAAAAGNHISNKKLARFLHLLVHCLLYAEPVAATAAGIQGAHRSTICISIEHHATSTTTTTASSSSSSRLIKELGSMPTIGGHTSTSSLMASPIHIASSTCPATLISTQHASSPSWWSSSSWMTLLVPASASWCPFPSEVDDDEEEDDETTQSLTLG